MDGTFDLAVIGGGINGCGIARDAVGRGLSVYLCEQGDLGGATSSSSTKLIHGGLRYLEHYEFRLVREALSERETLWRIAPHIVWPLRFVLPHRPGLRPAWLLRLGLLLYDHIGGRALLPGTRSLDLRSDPAGRPLRPGSIKGFEYSDCWVQDNRLVVLNARDAAARGAVIEPRTACRSARREDGAWRIELEDRGSGARRRIRARALVNATGPWVEEVLSEVVGTRARGRTRLVQGSHIVVPRLYDHERCYIFQNPDGRIFFAIPYEEDFTLIGTTDRDFEGDPAEVEAGAEEVDYLCEAASRYFSTTLRPADVVWSYAGVRPLFGERAGAAQKATRDYVLELDDRDGRAPLLSVFGGKITTYRRLAEDALRRLQGHLDALPGKAGWTGEEPLPGGDFAVGEAEALARALAGDYPFLSPRQARRYLRHYGTESWRILGDARAARDLGRDFGGDLSEAEVEHLIEREWARSAEDVVWRRTKSGLRMTAAEVAALDRWIAGARTERPLARCAEG